MPDLVKRKVTQREVRQEEVPRAFRDLVDMALSHREAWNTFCTNFQSVVALSAYPVGSVYTTTDLDFDPNVTFGGTWTEGAAGVWERTV